MYYDCPVAEATGIIYERTSHQSRNCRGTACRHEFQVIHHAVAQMKNSACLLFWVLGTGYWWGVSRSSRHPPPSFPDCSFNLGSILGKAQVLLFADDYGRRRHAPILLLKFVRHSRVRHIPHIHLYPILSEVTLRCPAIGSCFSRVKHHPLGAAEKAKHSAYRPPHQALA